MKEKNDSGIIARFLARATGLPFAVVKKTGEGTSLQGKESTVGEDPLIQMHKDLCVKRNPKVCLILLQILN